MIKELTVRVTPKTAAVHDELKLYISTIEDLDINSITSIRIVKRSIDARQRNVMVNLKVQVFINEVAPNKPLVAPIEYNNISNCKEAVVVGAGPAGLFAALRLIELGVRPIVVERGKNVDDRLKDVAKISREGIVDPESNYCFGEGGAGAYSDGKLYTRSKKRGSIDRILGIFHQHGASEDILVDAHPHIGTDKLPKVIKAMRETIISCGGEVHFATKVTDLLIKDNEVIGVKCSDEAFYGPVILATGHSARDIYTMLKSRSVAIEAKGIAVGVRLEHPQHLIDCIQYHNKNGRGKYLPAAEYNFVTQVDGRGVYSFCMCPGGFIVPAASDADQLVVNGMSPSNRGTKWANSGMVVEINPEDLPEEFKIHEELCMMKYQEYVERICYEAAGNSQKAGAQRMLDFVEGRPSKDLPNTSYAPGIQTSRLDKWMPLYISNRLRKGFKVFGRSARGFLTNDAIVIGMETRTSAPVRIPRDNAELNHINIKGLYPCGEGAGYAGGIVSAAIDGERCAEALFSHYGIT
ncbi:MAG: FAD-dependent monooxygenase [Muribaculaceae bacterium]|nr:FAD-dependent monooxygenase [Muribaculaceae bacterium]